MIDGNEFRESPDAQVARASVDLVAYLVVAHLGTDTGHNARKIVAEHERRLVLQEQLEFAVAYHLVQRVDAGGANSNKDVTGLNDGVWDLGGTEAAFAILLDDECLHVRPVVAGAKRPRQQRVNRQPDRAVRLNDWLGL